jgi:RimJ/RimL family protein N-acetyltransferase
MLNQILFGGYLENFEEFSMAFLGKTYNCLKNQNFNFGAYSLIPIRYEDRNLIMKWRNEQIYHLRQNKPLTASNQNNYFSNVVAHLFQQEKPQQILFSYLNGDKCIGYGGLVHINWVDQHAEISFIMNTELEQQYFSFHWSTYLKLIEEVAFKELRMHKIFVYAFDLRPHLYPVLVQNGYVKEAELKEHCFFNSAYKNVVIHSKFNN